jgi:hypothetical protein
MKFQEFLSDTMILIKHGWNFKSFGTKEVQRTCEMACLQKKIRMQIDEGFLVN